MNVSIIFFLVSLLRVNYGQETEYHRAYIQYPDYYVEDFYDTPSKYLIQLYVWIDDDESDGCDDIQSYMDINNQDDIDTITNNCVQVGGNNDILQRGTYECELNRNCKSTLMKIAYGPLWGDLYDQRNITWRAIWLFNSNMENTNEANKIREYDTDSLAVRTVYTEISSYSFGSNELDDAAETNDIIKQYNSVYSTDCVTTLFEYTIREAILFHSISETDKLYEYQYGDVYSFGVAFSPIILSENPSTITVTANNETFQRFNIYNCLPAGEVMKIKIQMNKCKGIGSCGASTTDSCDNFQLYTYWGYDQCKREYAIQAENGDIFYGQEGFYDGRRCVEGRTLIHDFVVNDDYTISSSISGVSEILQFAALIDITDPFIIFCLVLTNIIASLFIITGLHLYQKHRKFKKIDSSIIIIFIIVLNIMLLSSFDVFIDYAECISRNKLDLDFFWGITSNNTSGTRTFVFSTLTLFPAGWLILLIYGYGQNCVLCKKNNKYPRLNTYVCYLLWFLVFSSYILIWSVVFFNWSNTPYWNTFYDKISYKNLALWINIISSIMIPVIVGIFITQKWVPHMRCCRKCKIKWKYMKHLKCKSRVIYLFLSIPIFIFIFILMVYLVTSFPGHYYASWLLSLYFYVFMIIFGLIAAFFLIYSLGTAMYFPIILFIIGNIISVILFSLYGVLLAACVFAFLNPIILVMTFVNIPELSFFYINCVSIHLTLFDLSTDFLVIYYWLWQQHYAWATIQISLIFISQIFGTFVGAKHDLVQMTCVQRIISALGCGRPWFLIKTWVNPKYREQYDRIKIWEIMYENFPTVALQLYTMLLEEQFSVTVSQSILASFLSLSFSVWIYLVRQSRLYLQSTIKKHLNNNKGKELVLKSNSESPDPKPKNVPKNTLKFFKRIESSLSNIVFTSKDNHGKDIKDRNIKSKSIPDDYTTENIPINKSKILSMNKTKSVPVSTQKPKNQSLIAARIEALEKGTSVPSCSFDIPITPSVIDSADDDNDIKDFSDIEDIDDNNNNNNTHQNTTSIMASIKSIKSIFARKSNNDMDEIEVNELAELGLATQKINIWENMGSDNENVYENKSKYKYKNKWKKNKNNVSNIYIPSKTKNKNRNRNRNGNKNRNLEDDDDDKYCCFVFYYVFGHVIKNKRYFIALYLFMLSDFYLRTYPAIGFIAYIRANYSFYVFAPIFGIGSISLLLFEFLMCKYMRKKSHQKWTKIIKIFLVSSLSSFYNILCSLTFLKNNPMFAKQVDFYKFLIEHKIRFVVAWIFFIIMIFFAVFKKSSTRMIALMVTFVISSFINIFALRFLAKFQKKGTSLKQHVTQHIEVNRFK